jgi:hypothetical protein
VDDPADPGAEFVHISEWMLDVASDPERRALLIGAGGGSPVAAEMVVSAAVEVAAAPDVEVLAGGQWRSLREANAVSVVVVGAAGEGDGSITIGHSGGKPHRVGPAARAGSPSPPRPTRSCLTEARVLLQRSALTVARDPSLLLAHLLVAAFTGLLLGVLYLNAPKTLAGKARCHPRQLPIYGS